MSAQGNILKEVIQRQVEFNEALKARVKSDKVKEEQLKALRIRAIKKPKRTKG
jgi:hypothetical protein